MGLDRKEKREVKRIVKCEVSKAKEEIQTWGEQRIEIPNTAFADKTNPTTDEVKTWVDTNLTDLQKVNSQLYMVEQELNAFVEADSPIAFQGSLGFGGGPYILVDYTINGTTYTLNEPFTDVTGEGLTDYTSLISAIGNVYTSEGYTFDSIYIFQDTGGTVRLDHTNLAHPSNLTISIVYNIWYGDFGNFPTTKTINFNQEIIQTGSNAENPDYIWNIINDEIQETFRRTNEGNVYYVDSSTPDNRIPFSQKGNSDRPFQTYDDIITYDNIQDGDKIIFRKGPHDLSGHLQPNVFYHFEPGATISEDITVINGDFYVTGHLNSIRLIIHNGFGKFNVEADEVLGVYSMNTVGSPISDNHYINIDKCEYMYFNSMKSTNSSTVFVRVKKLKAGVGGINFYGNARNINFDVHIDEYHFIGDGTTFQGQSGIVFFQTTNGEISENVNITVNVNSVTRDPSVNWVVTAITGNYNTQSTAIMDNCKVDINVNQWLGQGVNNATNNPSTNGGSIVVLNRQITNSKFNVKIDNLLDYSGAILDIDSPNNFTDNDISIYIKSGNFLDNIEWNNGGMVLSNIDDTNTILLSGSINSDNAEDLISGLPAGGAEVILQDFKYKSPGHLGTISKPIYLNNTQFIKDTASPNATATTGVLTATVPLTIPVNNFSSNVVGDDANTTMSGFEIRNTLFTK